MGSEVQLSSAQAHALLRFGEVLHSTLDLRSAFRQAVPILQSVVGADHVALAVSRPGSRYDYEWLNTTLPEAFLGGYAAFAHRDFVRKAVAQAPNVVMRDQQMLSRKALERHLVYRHAKQSGARLEQVMAVMLAHEHSWSSGLSLYRSRKLPFSDTDASILQLLVPQICHAVQNSRTHQQLTTEALLGPTARAADIPIVWVSASLREVTRTPAATRLLEQYFRRDELHAPGLNGLPDGLLTPLREYAQRPDPVRVVRPWHRSDHLSCLHARYLRVPGTPGWAIVLYVTGLAPELQRKLTPRLREVAGLLMRGLTNEEIAAREGRALATIKQQSGQIYARLGIRSKRDLIRLASGLGPDVDGQ